MIEQRKVERRIEMLRPKAQVICNRWLRKVQDEFKIDARIIETLRSIDRQAVLQASGASTVKLGWHQFGLAFDFLIFENGKPVNNGDDLRYLQIGEFAESLGCNWGGRFDIKPQIPGRQPDSGHIEFHPGFTLQHLLAAIQQDLIQSWPPVEKA